MKITLSFLLVLSALFPGRSLAECGARGCSAPDYRTPLEREYDSLRDAAARPHAIEDAKRAFVLQLKLGSAGRRHPVKDLIEERDKALVAVDEQGAVIWRTNEPMTADSERKIADSLEVSFPGEPKYPGAPYYVIKLRLMAEGRSGCLQGEATYAGFLDGNGGRGWSGTGYRLRACR